MSSERDSGASPGPQQASRRAEPRAVWRSFAPAIAVDVTVMRCCRLVAAVCRLPQVHQHIRKQVKLDATDAFKQLKPQQRWRLILFGAYCCTFILATYR